MNEWAVVGTVAMCCLCLAGVYWAGTERGWDRGYVEGRDDAERLLEVLPEEPYAGRSAPDAVPTDPRPGARGNARLRTTDISSGFVPDDDWRYPDPD